MKFFADTKLQFDFEIEDGVLSAKAKGVSLTGLDDDILIVISVYENDAVSIEFIFDKVQDRAKAFEYINEINRTSAWMKSYIDSKDFLVVQHSILTAFDEDALIEAVGFILNYVSDEKFIEKLKPLSLITQ